MDSIEDIILDRDGRNISALRPHLRERFCDDAAAMVYDCPGTAIIVTGFHILAAGRDGDGRPAGRNRHRPRPAEAWERGRIRDRPLYGACHDPDGGRQGAGHRLPHRES